jgi:hypothetical protein
VSLLLWARAGIVSKCTVASKNVNVAPLSIALASVSVLAAWKTQGCQESERRSGSQKEDEMIRDGVESIVVADEVLSFDPCGFVSRGST